MKRKQESSAVGAAAPVQLPAELWRLIVQSLDQRPERSLWLLSVCRGMLTALEPLMRERHAQCEKRTSYAFTAQLKPTVLQWEDALVLDCFYHDERGRVKPLIEHPRLRQTRLNGWTPPLGWSADLCQRNDAQSQALLASIRLREEAWHTRAAYWDVVQRWKPCQPSDRPNGDTRLLSLVWQPVENGVYEHIMLRCGTERWPLFWLRGGTFEDCCAAIQVFQAMAQFERPAGVAYALPVLYL